MNPRQHVEQIYREAVALKAAGRLDAAQALESRVALFLEELETRARRHPDDPQSPEALLFLAERAWSVLGDHPDVLSRLESALALSESHFGPDSPAAAGVLAKLAEFHFLAGRYGQAEPLYRRAIAVYERSGAARPDSYAPCHEGLAETLARLGRPVEADPFFAKAIAWGESPQGDKRALYFLYVYRAEGLVQLGRGAEAASLRQKADALLPKNNPGEAGFHV